MHRNCIEISEKPASSYLEAAKQRRSPRLNVQLPIRVFGTDYQGLNFCEDSTTLTVNRHGGKICLTHQPAADRDILVLCHPTGRGERFRIVTTTQGADRGQTILGVECRKSSENIWGISYPAPEGQSRGLVAATLVCPACHAQEALCFDPQLLEALEDQGLHRACGKCRQWSLWKLQPQPA